MKFYNFRGLIDDNENVSLYNGMPIYVTQTNYDNALCKNVENRKIDNDWLNRRFLEEEPENILTSKYDDCEVVAIWHGENALCIAVDAYIEVTATFRTELEGYEFDKEITYNKFDFEDDYELGQRIDDDFDEWLDELVDDLRSYADKEVEGM